MTTIVNSTTPTQAPASEGAGSGFLIGILVFIVFLVAVLYFGIPALNRMQPVEVNVPATQVNVEAPQVVIPDKVEVVPAE